MILYGYVGGIDEAIILIIAEALQRLSWAKDDATAGCPCQQPLRHAVGAMEQRVHPEPAV